MHGIIFVAITACIFGSSFSEHVDLGTVVFANILFRHGDRTPVDPYPNDPWRNESLWPVPFGQLTNIGKRQHLKLGQWFRKRYSHLLSEEYSPYDIHVQSTDVDRTLMSAEANLAGLYPPHGNQIWDKLMWLPIPVHTIPENEDSLLAGKKHCPKYERELENFNNLPEIKKIYKDNKELFDYLSKYSGSLVASLSDIEYIYNTLFIEDLYNRTLPAWTRSVFPDKMKPLAEKSFTIEAYNKIMQRLRSGPLLGDMVNHLLKKSENTLFPDRKLWMYSAHDTTIANFLMTLNLFDLHCPPYAATVFLELRENSMKQHIVTISYKNTSAEPKFLILPGCTVACPLDEFIRLTEDMIPIDWEEECLIIGWEEYGRNVSATSVVAVLTSLVLILVLLVLLIVGFVYWHHNCDSNRYYLKLTTESM